MINERKTIKDGQWTVINKRETINNGLWTVIDGWKTISEGVLEHNLCFPLHAIICLITHHYELPCYLETYAK